MKIRYDGRLLLGLYGRFSLVDDDGVWRAPKSAKAQALLVMVATSETGSRGRLWLQKTLWSRSDPDRASMSLRQTLSELRRALGPARDVLAADRRSVRLDMTRIDVAARQGNQAFLAGLGFGRRDDVLAKWLDRERSSAEAQSLEVPLATPVTPPIHRTDMRSKFFHSFESDCQIQMI